MAEEHVKVLMQARENFVRKRREMAEQMVPEGAAAAHFAPSFADLQEVIEAIDRAIADEARLPTSEATATPDSGSGSDENGDEGENENVVQVDFEP